MKIRVKFRKFGVMKFIGHLDVMRYFQKAVRRAGIPVAYTGGFSPHQIMSFAAPLGVGLESNGEYMDLTLRDAEEKLSLSEIRDALQNAMAEGMEIVSVKRLPENAGNAMASVAAARYTVRFRSGYEPEFDWKSQLESFSQKLTIPVKKQTKKSVREMDLKPSLFELKCCGDAVEMLVDASSAGNIKPGLVMEALFQDAGAPEPSPFALLITREETYGRKEGALAPLEEFGEDD